MIPRIVGHRGAAGLAPENTVEAIHAGRAAGASALEVDVMLTRDGQVVCFHDERLERLTPTSGPLGSRDWEELRVLPVLQDAFEGRFPQARIPLLQEVLAAAGDTELVIEVKREAERPRELIAGLLECLDGLLERHRLISFSPELLHLLRQATPRARLGVLTTPNRTEAILPLAGELAAEAIHPYCGRVDADLIAGARRQGRRVNAWTVNEPAEALRLATLGVDEITTDYPDRLRAVLREA